MSTIIPKYPSNIWTISEMITHNCSDQVNLAFGLHIPTLAGAMRGINCEELCKIIDSIKVLTPLLINDTNQLVVTHIDKNKDTDHDENKPYRVRAETWLDCMLQVIESDKQYKENDTVKQTTNCLMSIFFDYISKINVVDMSYRVLTLRNQYNGNYPICTKVLYPGDSEFDMIGDGVSVNIAKTLMMSYRGIKGTISSRTDNLNPWDLDNCAWYYEEHLKDLYKTLIDTIHGFVIDTANNTPIKVKDSYSEFYSSSHPIHLEVNYFIGKTIQT